MSPMQLADQTILIGKVETTPARKTSTNCLGAPRLKIFLANDDEKAKGCLALLLGVVLSLALSAGAQDAPTPDITATSCIIF
jgi:hypothetical protein